METVLRIGLSNAVVALFMALVVVTVACVWRRPAVLHALWLLVLVKLLTPPLVWVRVPWPILPNTPPAAVAPTTEIAPVEAIPDENTALVADSEATADTPAVETTADPEASGGRKSADYLARPRLDEESASLRPPLAGTYALCGVWLAGAAAWYAVAIVRLQRFRRMLRHAILAPESLRQRTQRLAEKLRLRRCPAIWLVPGRVAPMLWAAGGRPRILFPAELLKQVSAAQQDALLVHELAHLRRRDHWVRWLVFTAAGLYWWNPVLWFARRELREAEEQCCDAWVTATLPGAGKTYATALLETLDFLSDAPPALPLLASGVGRVVDLNRRLTMIMRGTTPRTLGWRGAAAVIGLGALLLPLLPAWVQAQAPAKADVNEVQLKGDVQIVTDSGGLEDLEKAKAELKALEAQLEQKKAELAEAAARVEAARARVRRNEIAAKAADGDGALKSRITIDRVRDEVDHRLRAQAGDADYDIVVKVNGDADYKALQEFLKQIQALQVQGASPNAIILDKISGKILMKAASGKTVGVDLTPTAATQRVGSPPADTDKRIIDLEMKLKSLLNEVVELRRERTPDLHSYDGDSKPHSYGPTPLEKVPYINQFFKAVGPTQLLQEKTAMQEKLSADVEMQKARSAALAAERDAAQAKLKMLQDEIARLKNAQGGKEPGKP